MRVLMLGWELPPYNSGGLGVACYNLCKALADNDIDIEFILPYRHDKEVAFMDVIAACPQNVKEVMQLGSVYASSRYIYADGHHEDITLFSQQILYENAVAELAEQRTFDVIHAHDWLTFRAALRVKEKNAKTPLIVHVHSIERDRAGGNSGHPLVREIEAEGMYMADEIIAVSEHTKRCIVRDYGIPADKIKVVHNSIDANSLEELDDANAYHYLSSMKSKGYKVVTSIGRLTTQKGLTNLLKTAQKVVAHEPKTLFLVVGNGELYHQLIEEAADLGISKNVIFTGFQRGKNWRDAYAIGDVFVMPSVSEPFGLTPLEAIGYGTPSIISKQSGVSEVLRNCLKVDFWDVQKMANQIIAVIRNDALRDELHRNAYKEYQQLSWSDSAQKLRQIYRQHTAMGVRP